MDLLVPNFQDSPKIRQSGFDCIFRNAIADACQLNPLGISCGFKRDEVGTEGQATGRKPFGVFSRVTVGNKSIVPRLHDVFQMSGQVGELGVEIIQETLNRDRFQHSKRRDRAHQGTRSKRNLSHYQNQEGGLLLQTTNQRRLLCSAVFGSANLLFNSSMNGLE